MDFPAVRYLNSVKAIKLRYESVRISLYMGIVLSEYLSQQLVLRMVDCLYDIFVVPRKIEEAAAFAWGAEFRKYIFACQRHKIVGWIKLKISSKMTEYPRRIVLELEVVLCRRGQFVASASSLSEPKHLQLKNRTHMSKENLCFASKSASMRSRSIFALVLETVNRIPVNIL